LKFDFIGTISLKIEILNCQSVHIPRFRSYTNVEWVIYENAEFGNTIYLMNDEIDEGLINLSRRVDFLKI